MGLSKEKEERIKKKIKEFQKLRKVCGYCMHYELFSPGENHFERILVNLMQMNYQTGSIFCNLKKKNVNFTDTCSNYSERPLELKMYMSIMSSRTNDPEAALDDEIESIKEMRKHHR
ncbi:MAG TPA: hypothetical protein VMV49_03100 [Candidatus Deferrimicrobium sp.]|nr:hypothetical protein [Candidatus Deferrimicrobium sp.]